MVKIIMERPRRTVMVRRVPRMGNGLFAVLAFYHGDVVVTYKATRISLTEWNGIWVNEMGFESDASLCIGIAMNGNVYVYRDVLWLDYNKRPPWYRINHSRNPNVRVEFCAATSEVRWVATKKIDAGAQILWRYENAPADWQ
jgi:hypothetical protein